MYPAFLVFFVSGFHAAGACFLYFTQRAQRSRSGRRGHAAGAEVTQRAQRSRRKILRSKVLFLEVPKSPFSPQALFLSPNSFFTQRARRLRIVIIFSPKSPSLLFLPKSLFLSPNSFFTLRPQQLRSGRRLKISCCENITLSGNWKK
jgi:hypothetical protein